MSDDLLAEIVAFVWRCAGEGVSVGDLGAEELIMRLHAELELPDDYSDAKMETVAGALAALRAGAADVETMESKPC